MDVVLAVAAGVFDVLIWAPSTHQRFGGPAAVSVMSVFGLVSSSALLFRRRWPVQVFGAAWLFGLLPLAVPGHEPFAGLLISLCTVANRCATRVSIAVLAAAAVPLGINAFNSSYLVDQVTASGLLTQTALWLLFGVVAWSIGRFGFLTRQRTRLLHREHELQSAARITAERITLARELHDIVSHSVGAMIFQASVALVVIPAEDDTVRSALRGIETTGTQAMGELGDLLALLRSVDDGQPAVATRASLDDVDQLIATAEACNVRVAVSVRGTPVTGVADLDHAAYRVVQEGLANVVKHGGAAARAEVTIEWSASALRVVIWNDHRSRVAPGLVSGGYGLEGLSERVTQLGGTLSAGPDQGDGFTVTATFPLSPAEQRP